MQGLPFELLHYSRTYQKATYFGLYHLESVLTSPTFQDGGYSGIERDYRTRRLYVQSGFEGCVCGDTNSLRFTKMFDIHARRDSVPVHLTSVWPQYCSKHFLEDYALCSRTSPGKRYAYYLLFGRHLSVGKDTEPNEGISTNTNQTFIRSGVLDKRKQECSGSKQDSRVSGLCILNGLQVSWGR